MQLSQEAFPRGTLLSLGCASLSVPSSKPGPGAEPGSSVKTWACLSFPSWDSRGREELLPAGLWCLPAKAWLCSDPRFCSCTDSSPKLWRKFWGMLDGHGPVQGAALSWALHIQLSLWNGLLPFKGIHQLLELINNINIKPLMDNFRSLLLSGWEASHFHSLSTRAVYKLIIRASQP